jgi:hypothetical protein
MFAPSLKCRLLVWAILCSSILRNTSIFGIGIRKEPGIQSDCTVEKCCRIDHRAVGLFFILFGIVRLYPEVKILSQ